MAKLYPGNIGFCKSNAEKKLYNIFKTFSDDFNIIHSLSWLSSISTLKRNRFSPDGEIDFVIIHKTFGILCIEVKGGRISYNRHAFFTNGHQLKKSPYKQANDNAYAILDLTKELSNLVIGYAVGFPDSNPDKYNNDYDKITFNIDDENNLENKIIEIYKFWNETLYKKKSLITDLKIKQLLNILLPKSIDTVKNKISYDNRTWLMLSKEQTDIITEALNHDKYFISGRAGTGKTILAIILARILIEKRKGKILFLSFNKEITEQIKDELMPFKSNIDVLTFHHFLKIYNPLDEVKFVTKHETKVLNEIINQIDNPYDCLIIDEAQSLSRVWLNYLKKYFEYKKIYVFSDELQSFGHEGKILNSNMNKIFHFNGEKILTRNYRSPYKVYKRLLEMFTPSIEQTSPRSLDELDLIERISNDDLKGTIENTIDELLKQSIEKKNIVLLVSSLATESLKRYTYKDIETFTVQSYRGMEKPIVIYVITSTEKNHLNEFYVAYSRATTQTIVVIPQNILSLGKSHLEQLLLNSDLTDNNLKEKIHHEIEIFNDLLASNHNSLTLYGIKIFYSNKYILFIDLQYSFINKLLIEYFLKNNICTLTVNSYDLNTATIYTNIFEEMRLTNLKFEYCENCKTITYKKESYTNETFCINCLKDKFKNVDINEIKKLFHMLENLHKSKEERKNILLMDNSIKTLGRFFYHNYHKKLSTDVTSLINSQFDSSNINGIFKLLISIEKHKNEYISIEEIRSCAYIKKLIEDESKWKQELGININRFLNHELLEKINSNKKVYKINRNKIFKIT